MVNLYELPVLNTIPPKREMARALAGMYAAREAYWRGKGLDAGKKVEQWVGSDSRKVEIYATVQVASEIVADDYGARARQYRRLQNLTPLLLLTPRSYLERKLDEERRQPSLEAALAQPVQH